MTRKKGKREPPLYLDMDFGEALRRYAQVDPAEIPDNNKREKKAGTTKAPAGDAKNDGEPDASRKR